MLISWTFKYLHKKLGEKSKTTFDEVLLRFIHITNSLIMKYFITIRIKLKASMPKCKHYKHSDLLNFRVNILTDHKAYAHYGIIYLPISLKDNQIESC